MNLQSFKSQTLLNNLPLQLTVSPLIHHNSQIKLSVSWDSLRFQKSIRSSDFKIRTKQKKQSLYFIKLIIQQHPVQPQSLFLLSKKDISVKNVVMGKQKVEAMAKELEQNNKLLGKEMVEGVGLVLEYGGFKCFIQLPKMLGKSYESNPIFQDLKIQSQPDYQQVSKQYLLASLEEWFLN